jgi:hypothetical protein
MLSLVSAVSPVSPVSLPVPVSPALVVVSSLHADAASNNVREEAKEIDRVRIMVRRIVQDLCSPRHHPRGGSRHSRYTSKMEAMMNPSTIPTTSTTSNKRRELCIGFSTVGSAVGGPPTPSDGEGFG